MIVEQQWMEVKSRLEAKDLILRSVVVAREYKSPGQVIVKDEEEKYLIIPESNIYSARSLGFMVVER